jgi:hypothetical protein
MWLILPQAVKKKYKLPLKHLCKHFFKTRVGFFKPEMVVPESDISFSKFPVSCHLLKLFYDENTQFFYLLCSQFRQKTADSNFYFILNN